MNRSRCLFLLSVSLTAVCLLILALGGSDGSDSLALVSDVSSKANAVAHDGGISDGTFTKVLAPTVVPSRRFHNQRPSRIVSSAKGEVTCREQLHSDIHNWLSCIDPTVSAASNSLRWSSNNRCKFYEFASFDDPMVMYLFLTHVVEAHGDSTLREMLKLLVGGLRMEGTLDKRDASATLRYPKYFLKLWSNSTLQRILTASSGAAQDKKDSVIQKLFPPSSCATAETTQAELLVDCEAPAAYRVMFRFDFVPASFFEALGDSVPLYTLKPPPSISAENVVASNPQFKFFDRPPKKRLLLLATGSHTAKLLLMNKSTHGLGLRLAEHSPASVDGLFDMIIADVEAYVIQKILGLRVVRGPVAAKTRHCVRGQVSLVDETRSTAMTGSNDPPVDLDETLQRADDVIIFEETLECASMAEAKLSGFREMSAFCEQIRSVVHRVNEELRKYFGYHGGGEDGGAPRREQWHPCGAMRLLSPEQIQQIRLHVFLVPMMECHGLHSVFQYLPHKPYCTRDGIHLRTKFIRQKLNLLMNIMKRVDSCSSLSRN